MLHEVYAPRTVADVAWSRQKIVTLSTVIQQARGRGKALSSAAPHIVLLYGPPGCGKLETLKVLLCEDAALVDAPVLATHSTSHAGPGATLQLAQCHSTSFHIFHTCEATVPAYAQYLNSVVSYCRGQLGGGELQLPSLTESPASCMSSGGRSSSAGSRAGTMAGSAGSTELSTNHAHIIKFYGEPASHALHRCTLLFLREYEELRAMAQHEEQEQGPLLSSGTRVGRRLCLMQHLRRNLIFFLHTTHDTHNDKLDLSTSFPSTLLQSPAVELFHCTPITEINLRKRLQSILDVEVQRHAQKRRWAASTAAMSCFDNSLSSSSTVPPSASLTSARRTTKAKRKASTPTSAAVIATATACTASSSIDLIDPETLNAIVAGSQGDIRQALLQVQWLCLMPASNSLVPAAHQSGESVEGAWSQAAQAAATIWMRLEKQRLAARQGVVAASAGVADARVLSLSGTTDVGLSIYASHSTPCVSPAKPASKASGVVHREGKDEDGEIDSERESDVVEEVSSKGSGETVHIFSSAEFTSFPEPQTSRNGDDKTHAKVGGAASRKRPRQPSSPPAVNMLSLLDSQMERMQAMADVDGQRRRGPKSRAGRFAHRGAAPPASATGSQQRSVLPMTRDEYLGLSHAIGRLLTQKYCIDEVLGTLNVPPRKILDYLTNNQIRYFGDDQLPQYARCIDAASDADALRASELSGSFAGVPNAAALRERRQLADRTTAGENLGNMGRLLESIALQLFHLTYRAIQTEVRPPPGFVAQEPPPYLRLAYPRLRDISYSAMPYSMRRGEDRTEADPAAYISEREWVQQALARLESVPAVGARGPSASYGSDSNRRRRFDAGAGGGSSSHATLTPRIQAEEVDVLREGLPDLLYRCGSTEAVLLDYYALAPYILLTVSPPLPLQSSHAERIPASAALASLSQACEGTNTTAQSRGVHIAPDAPSLPSCSPGTSTMLTTAPRRTVFRFASSSLSASAPPLPVPSAHSVHKRPCLRPCTPLQMAILQRGRNPATAQLRSDLFVLSTDGVGDRTAGAATESSAERPLIPPGDEIEDIDED
ncbi:conserved hypothetical protein [Leishmania infantum JPCM5]|uniref:Rad17_cell_cycle_checkpoint_protein_-_putative n=2 Tax=Leishmania infantum TaxID=5671 RepID=A0A6L0XKR9_LEIIN|nr:conserved hypothetical protein [Leishmania infantum JPCM5]CAC9513474.1 Rad17_cell_cycle_checkpoint_protein_-_putative [Leishmania infantum]CAM70051.1 conserved hypothetical protein [Leishmania infantum JPCM5]SUZ43969.1 Rad17_cell_cycle_checkpoint_protein_-_putative [Leishmania infantum]|eukprot:XP_001467001.1 conserved hypothetical protein [Leishmania infantum JPCM5]